MSWVSENKFLTGFGAVMLVGVGTLGYFTYAAMDKYDNAMSGFETATAQLKKLQEAKPGLKDANLKELLAQKTELTEKIGTFQQELKSRVLPLESITKQGFQDKLKEAVQQTVTKAAAANVQLPKDFYLGFPEYQSRPPDDKATPALARELRALEMVMSIFIKSGSLELEEFHRDPLPEEGVAAAGKKKGPDRADHGLIERNGLRIKFTSTEKSLRDVITDLANHKQQLFIVRNVAVQNKMMEPPPRLSAFGAPTAPTAPEGGAPAPVATSAPVASEGPLSYVFGTEKITSTVELEILNLEEPKANSEKPEKGGKKKDK